MRTKNIGEGIWVNIEFRDDIKTADWKDPPDQVLESIDDLLKPHGLEVVMIDTLSDTYAFMIEKREE